MSRFRDELRVISPLWWFIALAVYFCSATLLFEFALPNDPKIGKWPVGAQALFAYGIFLTVFILLVLVGYVAGDAKRRHMRYVMWAVLALVIPNGIGIILYFVLRDPMPRPCPGCAKSVKGGVFCPHCGTPLQALCPHCKGGIEPGWTHCPHCGAALAPRATHPA
jgi:hypothetical protein